jgi:hypothetical protein
MCCVGIFRMTQQHERIFLNENKFVDAHVWEEIVICAEYALQEFLKKHFGSIKL